MDGQSRTFNFLGDQESIASVGKVELGVRWWNLGAIQSGVARIAVCSGC